jgi:hypothetical protein
MNDQWKMGTSLAALGLLIIVLVGAAPTSDDPSGDRPTLLTMSDEQARRLPTLHQEMRRVLIDERDRLEVLYAEFEAEADSRLALEIQQKIEQVKQETQVALLQAQVDAARADGRSEDVERLENGIRLLKEPDRVRQQNPASARPVREAGGG